MYVTTDYQTARTLAARLARDCRHDVAIRAGREYGRRVYAVRLASVNDSDYYWAEIVQPNDSVAQADTNGGG